jgi:Fic family protein
MIRETSSDIPEATFRRVLRDLKKEGIIESHGMGKKSYWVKTRE